MGAISINLLFTCKGDNSPNILRMFPARLLMRWLFVRDRDKLRGFFKSFINYDNIFIAFVKFTTFCLQLSFTASRVLPAGFKYFSIK